MERRLKASLPRFTPKTLVDRASLSAELAKVRRQGWAHDKGEYMLSVQAFAAPVADSSGRVVAALSTPFLAAPSRSASKPPVLGGARRRQGDRRRIAIPAFARRGERRGGERAPFDGALCAPRLSLARERALAFWRRTGEFVLVEGQPDLLVGRQLCLGIHADDGD